MPATHPVARYVALAVSRDQSYREPLRRRETLPAEASTRPAPENVRTLRLPRLFRAPAERLS